MQGDFLDEAVRVFKAGEKVGINKPNTEAHGLAGTVVDVTLPGRLYTRTIYGIDAGLGHTVYYGGDEIFLMED
ncbi:MAG: hypothetical protein ABFD89_22705 [Bryobacteraceae bacterium]